LGYGNGVKVVHLASAHRPFDTRVFHKECKALVKGGYEVILIVPHDCDEVVDGVRVRAVLKGQGRWRRLFRTVYQVYRQAIREDAVVYHLHDFELIVVGYLLKRHGKRVIYDVHEDVPRQLSGAGWIPAPLRGAAGKLAEWLENALARRFDAIVAATPFIRARFARLGCYTTDVNNYPMLEELNAAVRPWEEKERAVCYVGGLSVRRGVFELIEAIRRTDVRLLLVGRYAPADLSETCRRQNGWERVEALGFLDRAGVVDVLGRSRAGLVLLQPYANYLDSLPVKLFEYMAAGIPAIVSDFPFWKTIVADNDCGLCVDPFDAQAGAKAIQLMVDHPEEAQRMGENGRRLVIERYNWGIEAGKLLKAYETVLGSEQVEDVRS